MKRIATFVLALLDDIGIILASKFEAAPKSLSNHFNKPRAAFHRQPPNIDRSCYYYGLLDCISQLMSFAELAMMPDRLIERLENLLFTTEVVEFRWKAVSLIRRQELHWLTLFTRLRSFCLARFLDRSNGIIL